MVATPGLNIPPPTTGRHAFPIGDALLSELKRFGYAAIRIDCQLLAPWQVAASASEIIECGLQPLVVVRQADQIAALPQGSLVEIGNEPDITSNNWTPRSYAAVVNDCIPVALEHGHRCYVGVVSNLGKRGFDFLRDLPWALWPVSVCASAHRYPDATPQTPHPPARSREDEVAIWRRLVDPRGVGRPMAITEVGYNNLAFTESESADALVWERQFFGAQGIELVVAYQINDGAGTSVEAHYGIRRYPDLSWKPAATAFPHSETT